MLQGVVEGCRSISCPLSSAIRAEIACMSRPVQSAGAARSRTILSIARNPFAANYIALYEDTTVEAGRAYSRTPTKNKKIAREAFRPKPRARIRAKRQFASAINKRPARCKTCDSNSSSRAVLSTRHREFFAERTPCKFPCTPRIPRRTSQRRVCRIAVGARDIISQERSYH